MKPSQSPTIFQQNSYDVSSILGFVIKRNSTRGAKPGPSERQEVYYQEKQMLKKARRKKHGRHPTIISRWYADEENRKSLLAVENGEQHIMLFDRIALEKHHYTETKAERIHNSKHWILTVNAEGPQQPLNANECMTSTWQGPSKNIDPSLAVNKFDKKRATVRWNRRIRLRCGP